MKRLVARLMVYAALLGGAVIFLFPLVWMISTALKPIEQTMSLPPTWVPYQLYANVDGEQLPIRRGITIEEPACVIQRVGESRVLVVPQSSIREGKLILKNGQGEPVTVLQSVSASPDAPWAMISTEEDESRIAVPISAISRKVAFRWKNYVNAVKAMGMFPVYLKNTLILCFLTVLGTVLSSALAAYGFACVSWKGRDKVFILALGTMMIPFPVVMVPLYCMFRWLGWIGTLRPLWVGAFFAGAFNVFLLRQFFLTIPKDLSDAARGAGCSEFRIFWQIMLPLCRPALMVVGLFQFMYTWNDFLGPLIYLTDQQDFTLALGLQFFQSQSGGTEWHYLMAASTIVALPIIVLFFFTQRTFIEGISMTGLKG